MTVSSDGNDGDLMLLLTNKKTIRQQRCLEAASQPHPVLTQSMRRVGLVDITVGNATRLGASQRSTTRRCASHHIATQCANLWGYPAALARLARTVTLKRLWLRDGHVQRTHSLSPNPGRNASPICPDLIYVRHSGVTPNHRIFRRPCPMISRP
jgi:hypothetical protein